MVTPSDDVNAMQLGPSERPHCLVEGSSKYLIQIKCLYACSAWEHSGHEKAFRTEIGITVRHQPRKG